MVPQGTKAEEPLAICQSTNDRKAASSIVPSRIGVTKAGIDPLNIFYPFSWAWSHAI